MFQDSLERTANTPASGVDVERRISKFRGVSAALKCLPLPENSRPFNDLLEALDQAGSERAKPAGHAWRRAS